jgi:hypothetical protein
LEKWVIPGQFRDKDTERRATDRPVPDDLLGDEPAGPSAEELTEAGDAGTPGGRHNDQRGVRLERNVGVARGLGLWSGAVCADDRFAPECRRSPRR